MFDFGRLSLVSIINQGRSCFNSVLSSSSSLLAFENRTDGAIEVWDCSRMACGRVFKDQNTINNTTESENNTTAICFTPDNRYVVSAHTDCRVLMWSMMENVLYKVLVM